MNAAPANPGTPIARCPANGVEAYGFPFFVVRGRGVGDDFLLLEFHFWEMSAEDKKELGETIEVRDEAQLERLGYPRDEVGTVVVGGDPAPA